MRELSLFLIPAPGSKPEFLASLSITNPSPAVVSLWNDKLPEKIVLEGYTRDGWAWKPSNTFLPITVQSTDGRNKLPGFVDYLKQRQKAAFARFPPSGVWVVSYIQPKQSNNDPNNMKIECRVCTDMSQIPTCPLKPLDASAARPPKAIAAAAGAPKSSSSTTTTSTRSKTGFLGKLVGAQHRTNQNVAIAVAPTKRRGGGDTDEAAGAGKGTAAVSVKTAQQVLAEFRQSMQDKMLDFDANEDEPFIKIQLSLPEHTGGLSEEDKLKVTMEVLKYMVYEAAEEVNEEWICYKEPSEFMDEVTIAVYKEGEAPPDVLEEVNKAELPEEVRAQQRALQEERHRQVAQAESRNKQQVEMQAHRFHDEGEDDDELEALNKVKRDRRTIEDFERERLSKRSRG